MHTQFRKSLIASAIAMTLLGSGIANAADTLPQDINEARQETQIWTTYALNPHLRASDLKVSVDNGKATLSGKVEDDVNKDLAKQIALGVSGVTSVDNQIMVQSDYVPVANSTARSYGEMIDDASITTAIKSKLLWSKHADGLSTNVDTKLGEVTLTGTADTILARDFAGSMAMNTRGVSEVNNKLVIKAAKPTVADKTKVVAQEAGRDITDSWITTKVKSTYLYSASVDSSNIDVSTKGGVVTLTGKVDSGVERSLAVQLAENIRGVKKVQSQGLSI